MLGSGLEFGADSSNGAKWMTAVTWKPAPGWIVDVYADWEDLRGPGHRLTLQAFVAYQTETFHWGLQYSNQDRQENPSIELASIRQEYHMSFTKLLISFTASSLILTGMTETIQAQQDLDRSVLSVDELSKNMI